MEYLTEQLSNNGCNDMFFEYNSNNVAMIKNYNLMNNPERDPGQDIPTTPDSMGRLYFPDFCVAYLLMKKVDQNL